MSDLQQIDGDARGIHEKELIVRIMRDAGELARRIHMIDASIDDPATLKRANAITLDDYQKSAMLTANTARPLRDQIINAVLGLGGETSEVIEAIHQASEMLSVISGRTVDNIKKYFFHSWSKDHVDNPGSYEIIREKVAKELGDLLWYIAVLAYLFQWDLGEIGKLNRQKLVERHGTSLDNTGRNTSAIVTQSPR